jgi:hypothetical protein
MPSSRRIFYFKYLAKKKEEEKQNREKQDNKNKHVTRPTVPRRPINRRK